MKTDNRNRRIGKRTDEIADAESQPTTLEGIIVPAEWDNKGNAVAAAISTYNEDQILIETDEKGDELLACMRKGVELRGILRMEKNKKIITVSEFTLR